MDVMRDIGNRIDRYRLGRYAPPASPRGRRLRWILAGLLVWLAWASFGSDHSFYRVWRLEREHVQAQRELDRLRREQERLEDESDSPEAQRTLAERKLRENSGMARPGEIIYRVQGGTPDSARTTWPK
jgi:cell division protein FtsB